MQCLFCSTEEVDMLLDTMHIYMGSGRDERFSLLCKEQQECQLNVNCSGLLLHMNQNSDS